MSQNDVEKALTPTQVISSFSCLIKDGFTKDLLEKFAYINLGKYDVALNQELPLSNGLNPESEKEIFNGIVLKAKNFPELFNATAISLIYRTVETISNETLCEVSNDGSAFLNNINSVARLLTYRGRGYCEGYSVYISDNPRQILKVLEYAHGRIQFDDKSLATIEKQLDEELNKDQLYILVCGYSYSLGTSGQTLPYTLHLGTIDLNKEKGA